MYAVPGISIAMVSRNGMRVLYARWSVWVAWVPLPM
jgi:hypothetical protein